MASTNWKWEAASESCRRFWQGLKERYHQEGIEAAPGDPCPYTSSSFAALHWRRGAESREQAA